MRTQASLWTFLIDLQPDYINWSTYSVKKFRSGSGD